jgi:hypothetical protein
MKTKKHLTIKRLTVATYICMALSFTAHAIDVSESAKKCCQNADSSKPFKIEDPASGQKQELTNLQDCCAAACKMLNWVGPNKSGHPDNYATSKCIGKCLQ